MILGQNASPSTVASGGEMGRRMQNFDWRNGPLGSTDAWPRPLKTLASLMLDAMHPMFTAWGPELTMLYNDAYIQILGGKHPAALGRPFFEVWAEVRQTLQPLVDQAFTGVPVHMDDIEFVLVRNGAPEVAHFNFSYTPIRDESGAIGGFFCACMETTGMVLAKQRADQERERLVQLFEQGPSFMALLSGAEHRFELANQAYLRLVNDRALIGKTFAEALPDAVEQGYLKLLDAVFTSGEAFIGVSAKFDSVTSEGDRVSQRYVDFIYQPIRDVQGRITGIFVEGSDVSDRKHTEDALKASAAHLRSLNADLEREVQERSFDRGQLWSLAPDLLCVLGPGGVFESSNPAWESLLGWPAESLAGMSCFDLIHAGDRAASMTGFERIALGEPVVNFENRYRCRAGGWRLISWTAAIEGAKVYCIGRDVSRERAQASELAERTRERELLWANSRDLLHVIDRHGVMRGVSPAAMTILGWTPEEMEGRPIFDYIHPDDLSTSQQTLQTALREPVRSRVNRYRHKDGSYRWISWVATTQGELVYATGRDVTEDKEREAALAKTEEALRQAQKMEAVGQLTGGLAHDFNNLLAGISGSLEMVQTRISQGNLSAIDRFVTAAQGAAKRAAALTHRLLAFSRRQTLAPKATNVNRLVTDMEELIRRSVGPGVHVEVVGAGGLWTTLVDPNQLENALLNLCINGRDAMPDGGRLTIETANKWLDERAAEEHDLPSGQYITLCVTDSGTGMTPAVRARAFDPFFTTKPLGEGTGLGLSMIHGFARQSGGQVRIYSELGAGTTMCIYLPRHYEDASGSIAPAERRSSSLQGDGEIVLVVDDEPTIRMLIGEVLTELGYAAIEAADGPAGLKVLQSQAKIDLLITDVGLPGGMNGRQVADAGRSLRPGLKVLFITGYAENAVIGNGHLDAGMQIVTKPFSMEALARKIRELIES